MISSKIKKHFSLLSIRLQEKKTLQNMMLEKDVSLKIIVEAFSTIKSGKHESEDAVAFKKCEMYRESLLNNDTIVSYNVFGINKVMAVKDICRQATSPPIWAQFLYLIAKQIKTPYFLEIGTNLGVSGSYILEALKNKLNSKFITMEGVPDLCVISNSQFANITSDKKYTIYEGLYEATFPALLKDNLNFNILFIDGHHKRDSTLQYFNDLKSRTQYPAIFIFDDINWSVEMKQAWSIIKSDSSTSYSIDMFKLGIIIINKHKKCKTAHYKLHLSY
jgi:predicted O-methyltransferase YrrM